MRKRCSGRTLSIALIVVDGHAWRSTLPVGIRGPAAELSSATRTSCFGVIFECDCGLACPVSPVQIGLMFFVTGNQIRAHSLRNV